MGPLLPSAHGSRPKTSPFNYPDNSLNLRCFPWRYGRLLAPREVGAGRAHRSHKGTERGQFRWPILNEGCGLRVSALSECQCCVGAWLLLPYPWLFEGEAVDLDHNRNPSNFQMQQINGRMDKKKDGRKTGGEDPSDMEWNNSSGQSVQPLKENSVQLSRSVVSNSLRPHEPQYVRPPCPSPTPKVYPNPCPLCQWCHPTI